MELTLEEVGEFALGLSIISYYPDKLSWAVVFLFLSILKDVSFEAFEYMDPYLREITEFILWGFRDDVVSLMSLTTRN